MGDSKMSTNNTDDIPTLDHSNAQYKIGFDVAELQVINLKQGDVLSIKLIGDDFDGSSAESLRKHLKNVFPNNKVMVFLMPSGSDLQIQAIRLEDQNLESEPNDCGNCDGCNCNKGEIE